MPGDAPHVAVPGAEHGLVGADEVDPGKPQLGVPGIGVGGDEGVDGNRAGAGPGHERRLDDHGPQRRGRTADE